MKFNLPSPDRSLLVRSEILKTQFTLLRQQSSVHKAKSKILINQAHGLIRQSKNLEFKSDEIDTKVMKNRFSFKTLST